MKRVFPLLVLLSLSHLVSSCNEENLSPLLSDLPADFLPLVVGNEWSYSFSNFYRSPGGQIIDEFKGTAVWRVTSSSTNSSGTTYVLQETVNGTKVYTYDFGYARGSDTTVVSNAKFQFSVVDSVNHRLSFQFLPDSTGTHSPNEYIQYAFQSRTILRFQKSTADTLRYGGSTDYSVTLVKKVGIAFFRLSLVGNSRTLNEATLARAALVEQSTVNP